MNKIIIWIGVIVVILVVAFVFFQSGSQPTTEQQQDIIPTEDPVDTADVNDLETDEDVFDEIDLALDFLE